MRIQFLGSGDAFGSGGRLQTCILLQAAAKTVLLDCGPSALIAMRRFQVDPNSVSVVFLSHLHGDHFGGIPFFLLDAQLISKRTEPLIIAGPPGTRQRLNAAMEVLFPGSSVSPKKFVMQIEELPLRQQCLIDGVKVAAFPVVHPSGDPATALRLEFGGKTVAYSGDTEWHDALLEAAVDADLLIAEAYGFDRRIKYHLDAATVAANAGRLQAKRIILTHLGPASLARLEELPFAYAVDGLELEI
ncbi:MAG: MBL fold metallo-hydrolase [Sporomusaceae bacterium]|nr:MBL fold metallo-hydrolase [Sporomusaceae bacterium]